MKQYLRDNYYHIFNKSIARFQIFNTHTTIRFIELLDYYNNSKPKLRYSVAIKKCLYQYQNILLPRPNSLIKVIAYCIMPDHYHLLAKIIQSDCLSKYLGDVENGFSRYFNLTHHRHGPLWQSRFKAVRIKTNEQLLHVSRYIHLNPTTAQLVLLPQDWAGSSYCDFINHPQALRNWVTDISIYQPADYKRFVEDNQSHQLKLKSIKNVLFD